MDFSGKGHNHPISSPIIIIVLYAENHDNYYLVFCSRHDSGGSIFQRRLDYSSFNVLPKQKINSYHIKMEDECSIGNDETRIFILSSLASNKMNKVPCVLCNAVLTVYDRYPLIDGTFFLSPRQQSRSCIQVSMSPKSDLDFSIMYRWFQSNPKEIVRKYLGRSPAILTFWWYY